MINRESIQKRTAEMVERHEAHQARLVELEEVKRAHLRDVARALPEVPPELARYLSEPNVFLQQQRSRASVKMSNQPGPKQA